MHRNPTLTQQSPPAAPRAIPVPTLPRPSWVDYLLILFGCTLSLVLTDWSGYQAFATAETPEMLSGLALKSLPHMLFMPLGIVLLWPLFFATQRLAGRSQQLTAAEWLWGVAWLAALALTAWIAWQFWSTPPEFLRPEAFKGTAYVGYSLSMLALGAVGLLVGLADLIGRWPRPWTHPCFLALAMWPALPLLVIFLCRLELK